MITLLTASLVESHKASAANGKAEVVIAKRDTDGLSVILVATRLSHQIPHIRYGYRRADRKTINWCCISMRGFPSATGKGFEKWNAGALNDVVKRAIKDADLSTAALRRRS